MALTSQTQALWKFHRNAMLTGNRQANCIDWELKLKLLSTRCWHYDDMNEIHESAILRKWHFAVLHPVLRLDQYLILTTSNNEQRTTKRANSGNDRYQQQQKQLRRQNMTWALADRFRDQPQEQDRGRPVLVSHHSEISERVGS